MMLLKSNNYVRVYGDDFGNPIVNAPFTIGTIVELKENPDCVLKITQYRLSYNGDHKMVFNAGLAINIYEDNKVDFEIPVEDLEKNWKKTDVNDFNNIAPWRFDSECKSYEQLEAKLKLKREL